MQKPASGESSETVHSRVIASRDLQLQRQKKANHFLNNREIESYCKLKKTDEDLLTQVMEKFKLSARAYHRILKVARTITDLERSADIQTKYISEAVSYRLIAAQ